MTASIFEFLLSGPYITLIAAVLLVMAIYLQNAVNQRFQFKLVERWHVYVVIALLTVPTVIFFVSAALCIALDHLPLVPVVWILLAAASAFLARFNVSRTDVKVGVIATMIQMCAFSLALAAGTIPAATMGALASMGSGGRHSHTCGL